MKTPLILSLAAVLAALTITTAFADGRGNLPRPKILMKNPPPVETKANLKSCPTVTRTVVGDVGGRGAGNRVKVYAAHNCPTCQTEDVVKGVGKLAKVERVHTCQSKTGCCASNVGPR